jgi:hypothetical protein
MHVHACVRAPSLFAPCFVGGLHGGSTFQRKYKMKQEAETV